MFYAILFRKRVNHRTWRVSISKESNKVRKTRGKNCLCCFLLNIELSSHSNEDAAVLISVFLTGDLEPGKNVFHVASLKKYCSFF